MENHIKNGEFTENGILIKQNFKSRKWKNYGFNLPTGRLICTDSDSNMI